MGHKLRQATKLILTVQTRSQYYSFFGIVKQKSEQNCGDFNRYYFNKGIVYVDTELSTFHTATKP